MRYFKILNEGGNLVAFGKNDIIGVEITEEEYNALREQYRVEREDALTDAVNALELLGYTEVENG